MTGNHKGVIEKARASVLFSLFNWFSEFMGGSGSKSFVVENDEWYTFNRSPRTNVHGLANVAESSYNPPSEIKMGDHPVIWVNKN